MDKPGTGPPKSFDPPVSRLAATRVRSSISISGDRHGHHTANLASEQSATAWRGFEPGTWTEQRRRPRLHPAQLHPLRRRRRVSWQGATERTQRHVEDAAAAARRGAREGHPRRLAGSVEHPRARAGLHRQGQRDHRRPADRRAAEARDHAVRRLARGRGEPRVLRLQAGSERVGEIFTKYRKTHNDGVFDAYTPDIRRPHAPRASSPACRMPTAAAASSATTAASRSTASTSSSRTSSARRRSWTTATRPRT